jgi:PBSX family phage terminase large subunit
MKPPLLHEAQAKIAIDPHRFRVVCCGRRFGKTFMAIDQMKARCGQMPNSRVAYIAPTYQQARDICWNQLKKECEQGAKTINESRLEVTFVNDSFIVLRGWENIETLRGQKFDLIVIDEVASMRNFWENWQEIIRPTLTDTKGEGIFISTPKGFNHFYDLYNAESVGFPGGDGKPDLDFKSFHYNTYDNPHVPPEEVDKAKEELTEDRFAQEYLADFRKTEGLVYKEFSREKHVLKGEVEGKPIRKLAGVDFGFVHPAAVLHIDKFDDGRYVVSGEWYHSGKTDAQIAEYVAGAKFHAVYPDPENAGGVEELRRIGVNVRDVVKGKGSVARGINCVRELFKANRLFIHESCANLIFELETYSYGDKGTKSKVDENPMKENDDACDAMRYCLMMEPQHGSYNRAVVKRPSFVGFNKRG